MHRRAAVKQCMCRNYCLLHSAYQYETLMMDILPDPKAKSSQNMLLVNQDDSNELNESC